RGRVLGVPVERLAPLLCVLLARRGGRCRQDREARAVGRPLERIDAPWQVGEPARLAAVERQQVDLRRVLALLGVLRAVGLVLDEQAAIREEREAPTVGRE